GLVRRVAALWLDFCDIGTPSDKCPPGTTSPQRRHAELASGASTVLAVMAASVHRAEVVWRTAGGLRGFGAVKGGEMTGVAAPLDESSSSSTELQRFAAACTSISDDQARGQRLCPQGSRATRTAPVQCARQ
ncbi:hypothetical protein ACFXPV_31355, partial [Streptomyces sp. NPDC059118]